MDASQFILLTWRGWLSAPEENVNSGSRPNSAFPRKGCNLKKKPTALDKKLLFFWPQFYKHRPVHIQTWTSDRKEGWLVQERFETMLVWTCKYILSAFSLQCIDLKRTLKEKLQTVHWFKWHSLVNAMIVNDCVNKMLVAHHSSWLHPWSSWSSPRCSSSCVSHPSSHLKQTKQQQKP